MICFMSAAHVSLVSSALHSQCIGCWFYSDQCCFYCFWHCLIRHWFVHCIDVSTTCTLGLSSNIILVQWLLTLNNLLFLFVYFSTGYCIYIILNKGSGLDKSFMCVHDVLELKSLTNHCTWLFFNKHVLEQTFSVSWLCEVTLKK